MRSSNKFLCQSSYLLEDIDTDAKAAASVPLVMKKVKRMTHVLNHSPQIANMLDSELKLQKLPDWSMIQEMSTRGNSAY